MLNIKDELQNYEYIDMEAISYESDIINSEVMNLLKVFSKSYDRIGKEQYKAVNGIDEIIEILEEEKEKSDRIKELKESGKTKEAEIEALISVLTNIYDMIEYMSSFFIEKGDKIMQEQLRIMKEQILEKLSATGIAVLGTEGVPYNSDYYQPIGTECNFDKGEEEILKVIKKGYTYKGKLLRKAEVIVNKIERE